MKVPLAFSNFFKVPFSPITKIGFIHSVPPIPTAIMKESHPGGMYALLAVRFTRLDPSLYWFKYFPIIAVVYPPSCKIVEMDISSISDSFDNPPKASAPPLGGLLVNTPVL